MQTTSKECKNCENFDLSTNKCLQHDTYGYDEHRDWLQADCQDWVQCSGFVPDMSEHDDVDYLRYKADMFNKIADIVNSTDSYWTCDVKAAYIEIEKIVKGNLDHE